MRLPDWKNWHRGGNLRPKKRCIYYTYILLLYNIIYLKDFYWWWLRSWVPKVSVLWMSYIYRLYASRLEVVPLLVSSLHGVQSRQLKCIIVSNNNNIKNNMTWCLDDSEHKQNIVFDPCFAAALVLWMTQLSAVGNEKLGRIRKALYMYECMHTCVNTCIFFHMLHNCNFDWGCSIISYVPWVWPPPSNSGKFRFIMVYRDPLLF